MLGAAGAGLFILRVLGAPWPRFPLTYPDSYSFLKVANRGPLHLKFWFDERPVGFPLFLWTFGRSITLVTLAQTVLYVGAFAFVCATAVRLLSSQVARLVAIIGFTAIAIQPRFALWNSLVLSESLSRSRAVISLARWWRAAAAPTRRAVRWAVVWSLAWTLVRDANLAPVALVAGPVLVVLAFSRRVGRDMNQTMIRSVAALILVGAFVLSGDAVSHRNQYPMNNDVGMRFLPDPGMTRFFADHGMPLDAVLRTRTGHNSWDDGEMFLRDPRLENYREWARQKGRTWLAMSMVFKASWWSDRFDRELPNIVRNDALRDYDTFRVGDRLPSKIPFGLGAATSRGRFYGYTAVAFVAVAVAASRRRRLMAAFAFFGLLSALVDVYFSYVGDAMEVNRHLAGPMARLAIMSVIAVALAVDGVVEGRP